MKINEALQVFGLENAKGIGQVTMHGIFKKLVKAHHPDYGGEHLKMAMINDAWDTMKKAYDKDSQWCEWTAAAAPADYSVTDLMRDVLAKLQHLEGLDLTISGSWLWIEGNYDWYVSELKAAGCSKHTSKPQWYWSPPAKGGKKRRFRGKTMAKEKIYARYGAQKVNVSSHKGIQ